MLMQIRTQKKVWHIITVAMGREARSKATGGDDESTVVCTVVLVLVLVLVFSCHMAQEGEEIRRRKTQKFIVFPNCPTSPERIPLKFSSHFRGAI